MQTAISETESKSRDLSICVHHYTLRAPCPEGQGKPQWDTLLASCGRRSPLRSVFSRGKVSVDVHRVVCQVAKAVLIFITGTERARGCRLSFRLETPVRGGGAFTPTWGRPVVVRFGHLLHWDGGGPEEGGCCRGSLYF